MGKYKRARKEIHIQVKQNELDLAARRLIEQFHIPFEESEPISYDHPASPNIEFLPDEQTAAEESSS